MQQMGKTVFAISHDDPSSTPIACWRCVAGQLSELTGRSGRRLPDAVARTA